ncbi:hypothetical protein ACS0TY_002228 [Phlomoides rotata]
MSRKQVFKNLSSLSDINMHQKNLIDSDHFDYNSPLETHENLKEGAARTFSRFSCPPTSSFPCALKRPKVYATRDFPELCVAVASQVNANGNEDSINVATDEHSGGANANRVVGMTKTLKSIKGQPANLLASSSRTYDMEHKMNAHHLNEVPPPSITGKEKGKMAASLNSFKKLKRLASVKSADGCDVAVLGSNGAPKYNLKANDDKNKVKETLKLFRELCKKLSGEHKDETSRRRVDLNAADWLRKQGKWINSTKGFGHIPGISIGDQFNYRVELAVVGLHSQYMSGIDYIKRNGNILATSIVDSGYYDNKAKSVDVMVYSGQGGHKVWSSGEDQKLERGNLALANSMEKGNPVRVIKKKNLGRDHISYMYDGLYLVKKYWTEKNGTGNLVYKFELHRRSSQERPNGGEFRKSSFKECCVMDDVSLGKESVPIRAMNGMDGERPQTFAYTMNMRYSEWCKQMSPCRRGCDCTNGCSNSKQCLCVLKNGGEIQFNEKGGILLGKEIVYECGPFCKCPPSCMNRVSQHGPRYKLELYKTGSSQVWGVRSSGYISSGSFVCEYVGDWKKIEEEGRVLGVRIDASKVGNVGRFIMNSSSSPNLFVQRILYDHEDSRVPHIMLFAAKNIRPLQGLSCDFNHHGMEQVAEFQYQVRV